MVPQILRILTAGVLAALALIAFGYWSARQSPVIRRADVHLPGWPKNERPITVALLSDIHIGNASTDASRFERVAAAIAEHKPDLVLIAGDFIAGHDRGDAEADAPALIAGLRRMHPPLGIVAVPGNHDHWTGLTAVRRALKAGGARLLVNDATRRGPIALGGLDDMYTRHADLPRTLGAMHAIGGARVLLSHSPDVSPHLPAGDTLVLAGHTHCGQIDLPLYGPPVDISLYGARYRCGLVKEGSRTTIVSAGIGTSSLPLRFRVSPDVWLVRLGP